MEIENSAKLADHIVSTLPLPIKSKQKILSKLNVKLRLEETFKMLKQELQVLEAQNKIKDRVRNQLESTQREYYLNEQLKALYRFGEVQSFGENCPERDEFWLLPGWLGPGFSA